MEDRFSPIWTIGFMSGTSLDAVDAAMTLTDGERIFEFGPVAERKYSREERGVLAEAVTAARAWNWQGEPPEDAFGAARRVLTKTHKDAFDAVLAECSGDMRPQLAGIHGQTVLHRPPSGTMPGETLQILDAEHVQRALGISIAYDFRTADMKAGGQGAPLAPIYHQALCADMDGPVAVLNLGGVANLTYINRGEPLLGFDCGPANGPIDEWVERHGRGTFDKDGAIARAGKVDEVKLEDWLAHPWFDLPLPKSLDRYDFSAKLADGMRLEDGAATLTGLSAAGVVKGLTHFPQSVFQLIVCGGGRHNSQLMAELSARALCPVHSAEDLGWRGDSIEAEAFALLAVRSLRGLPFSFPGTTGAPNPMTGGKLIKV